MFLEKENIQVMIKYIDIACESIYPITQGVTVHDPKHAYPPSTNLQIHKFPYLFHEIPPSHDR